MPSAKLRCRVCGKEYSACLSALPKNIAFRWQEVACSPECGEKYLHAVLKERGLLDANPLRDDVLEAEYEGVEDEFQDDYLEEEEEDEY